MKKLKTILICPANNPLINSCYLNFRLREEVILIKEIIYNPRHLSRTTINVLNLIRALVPTDRLLQIC